MSTVRCYAGDSYPERPIEFYHAGDWRQVAEIIGRARTPHGIFFRVKADDGRRYRLFWDEQADTWEISPQRKDTS